jgi:hypothetical protein
MLRRGRLGLQAVPLLPDLEHPRARHRSGFWPADARRPTRLAVAASSLVTGG